MIGERDIVGVSLAMAAGSAAACLPGFCRPGLFLISVFCLSAILVASKTPADRALLLSLWFAVGCFCQASFSKSGAGGLTSPLSINWLADAIDGTGFGYEGTAPLLKALLTGQKNELPPGTVAAFRASGASHVLALSGLHLGIIYGAVSKALAVLGQSRTAFRLRAAGSVTLCGAYVLMTGASPSIVRAFLFIAIGETGRLLPWRSVSPVRTWCLSLLVQLSLFPPVLRSLGFQLSYLAMLGIFLVFPVMRDWYPGRKGPDPFRKIWEAVALSTSCQLFTAPLVWFRFGTFPKYFILTNLLALPLTEALILGGISAVAASALDCCPDFLVKAVDFLAKALVRSLETISRM